jgi:hypothetical protein
MSERDKLHSNNDKYHYDDIQDPNILIHPEESKDIKTGLMNDVNEMKLYQNSIYISTAIAGATFLIAALILSKNK